MNQEQTNKDHPEWWRRTRLHVALLGLSIAIVNCYAQATFCIAIVEMVLPPDYVYTTETGVSALVKVSSGSMGGNSTNSIDVNISFRNNNQLDAKLISGTHESKLVADLDDQSCPIEYKYRAYYDSWRFPSASSLSSSEKSNNSTGTAYSMVNQLESSMTGNNIDVSNRFDWDASHQGILLGAFALGTAPLQVLGGRLAEMYGAKWVLLSGCIGTALANLTIPCIAHSSFLLLVINRIIMGISQAGMEPGLMCLLAKWLTPDETGFFISMLLFAICFGFFFGSLCSSFILALGYGWPLAYYVAGTLNLLVGLVWYIYADSWPETSAHIDDKELRYIISSQRVNTPPTASYKPDNQVVPDVMTPNVRESSRCCHCSTKDLNYPQREQDNISFLTEHPILTLSEGRAGRQTTDSLPPYDDNVINSNGADHKASIINQQQAPWHNILTTPSVWAFIICKISIRWCADVLSIELPTYLANVLHLSIKLNGILNSVSSALFAIFSFLTGYLVNRIVKENSNGDDIGRKPSLETYTARGEDQSVNRHSKTQDHNNNCHTFVDGFSKGKQSPINNREGLIGSIGRPKSRLSKTALRKLFQSCASFGAAMSMFLMTHYDCNIVISMAMLLLLSCCLVMGTGGELQIPYDMTSKYPGTLHGMACTLSVSGWLAPPLIGLILGDQPSSRARWSIVWYLTAFINLIGGLVFVLFADASPRDFDRKEAKGPKPIADERKTDKLIIYDNERMRPLSRSFGGATGDRGGIEENVCRCCESSGFEKSQQKSTNTAAADIRDDALSRQQIEAVNRNASLSKHCVRGPQQQVDGSLNRRQQQQQQQQQQQRQVILPRGKTDSAANNNNNNNNANNNNSTNNNDSSDSADSLAYNGFFDERPIRIRQLEASFVEPNSFYPAHLTDSVARHAIVFPYREKQLN